MKNIFLIAVVATTIFTAQVKSASDMSAPAASGEVDTNATPASPTAPITDTSASDVTNSDSTADSEDSSDTTLPDFGADSSNSDADSNS